MLIYTRQYNKQMVRTKRTRGGADEEAATENKDGQESGLLSTLKSYWGGNRRHRGGYAGSVKHPGAAAYATAVGGRRRKQKGGNHGVTAYASPGVAAYASPFTQGGSRRRRRTRRRYNKK